MSERVANCPNCGAPIKFLWSSAVQTTCEFCHSILVRRDVDLQRVGEVADLPPDSSPIQIASEGVYAGKPFVVVGRILYEYEQGGWNEWNIIFNDSRRDRKSTRLNSSHLVISYAVFCLKKKKKHNHTPRNCNNYATHTQSRNTKSIITSLGTIEHT